jgi:tetratricopeptide (TPR) repeat protein
VLAKLNDLSKGVTGLAHSVMFMLSCSSYGKCLGRVIAAVLFLLVCLKTAFAQSSDVEASQHFAAAQRAQNAGLLDYAAQEYLKVIQLLPDTAEAYASLGLVYNAQGKYAESAQALTRAEKLKPGLPGVSLYLGIDYLKRQQAALALPYLKEALRLDPNNEQAYTWLSEAASDDGQLDTALKYLQKASLLFPSDPVLLFDLGQLYRRTASQEIDRVLKVAKGSPLQHQVYGEIYKDERAWQNAKAHYYRALEEDSHWLGAHFGLGEIAFQNGEFDLAIKEYRQELELDPRSAAAMARLAEIALLDGRANDAVRLFSSAIRISPEEAAHAVGLPRSYPAGKNELSKESDEQLRKCLPVLEATPPGPTRSLAVAVVDFLLGQNDAFTAAWKEFQDAAPYSSPPSLYKRALADFNRQELNAAETNLRSWLNLHPSDLQASYLLARTYQTLSFYTFEKLLELAPDSYPAHQALAEIYEDSENNDKALGEYRMVENLAPNLSGIHFFIGSLLLKMHRQDEALTELETELSLNPDNPEANAEVGTIFLDRLDTAKAIPYLERAVQQDSDLWSARQRLGKAYYMQKEFSKAITELQQAIRHDADGSAHFQLGLAYRALGQTEEAGKQFEISRKIKLESLSHAETEMTTLQTLPQ